MASVVALTELLQLNIDGSPVSRDNPIPVAPENITGKFRESFESFTPGVNWTLVTGSGDIVQTDGNAVSASYLVISKDPLTTETETSLTYIGSFPMPIETSVGLSMSQRTLGQELSMELVSTETPITPVANIAISSIVQATTTLTVTTSAAHGLVPGKRIGIRGITSDSRLNYPSVVVATTPSLTTFTVTAGPGGNIASGSLGPYTSQGFVYFRSAMGYAQNGMSEVFENASATNASMYVRSSSGDTLPSSTVNGNQSVTVSGTASVQAVASAYTYAFLPSSEYRLNLQADRAQFYDAGIDSTTTTTSRILRTQVVPDPTKQYTIRFRFTNVDSLPIPNGKITSAVKTGSSVATITTATDHGLTTGDFVTVYGIGDTTNFANQTAQVQVASVPTSTTLTVSFGASVSATSAGGLLSRSQGGTNIQGVQATIAAQASSTSTQLTLVGSASWSLVIGDYVNVYGLRNRSTGADLGFDGAYKVVDQVSSTLTLEPVAWRTPLPAPLTLTNTGGAVIRRTDARIAFVRIFEYLRERVELMARPGGDASAAVTITGTNGITVAGNLTPLNSNVYTQLTGSNLAANATFTGTSTNAAASSTSAVTYNTAINVSVLHTAGLTPGTLIFEVGNETSSTAPTVWFAQFIVPIASNQNWQTFTFPLTTRWYRVRFVNGSTAQTSFRLTTMSIYNGALSSELTFPNRLLIPLSTTTLGISAAFTGATLDFGDTGRLYITLTATVFADQASASNGFTIQVSRDASVWRTITQATVTANTLTTITADLVYRYARVVYTNGAVANTTFSLDCQASV
jgi:hypothetical protein